MLLRGRNDTDGWPYGPLNPIRPHDFVVRVLLPPRDPLHPTRLEAMSLSGRRKTRNNTQALYICHNLKLQLLLFERAY